jgi:hypothetical protein
VGGKQHSHRRAHLCTELCEGGTETFGKGLGEERMLRPGGGKVDAQNAGFGLDGTAIEAHAGAGVLWRHADDRCFFDAIGAHLADDVGNVGTPVSHADVDRSGLADAGRFRFG